MNLSEKLDWHFEAPKKKKTQLVLREQFVPQEICGALVAFSITTLVEANIFMLKKECSETC